MKELIAYCGLDCESCDARIATVNNDEALKQKTAELWSQLNGFEITADMMNCLGCRCDGVKTPYCDSMCGIRKCAMAKGFNTCGDCGEMDNCELLRPIIASTPDALERLKGGK